MYILDVYFIGVFFGWVGLGIDWNGERGNLSWILKGKCIRLHCTLKHSSCQSGIDF